MPADLAARTLKLFAQQSGSEVMISAELGREIRTRPVKGDFTPREALERMLMQTGLAVKHDLATGVMAVMRAADANQPGNGSNPGPPSPAKKKSDDAVMAQAQSTTIAPSSESKSSHESQMTMKRKSLLRTLTAWFGLAIAPLGTAQTSASDGSTAQGYRAASDRGTITGRVQNVVTGKYLTNARVSVDGTGLVAFTDESGIYRLTNVPSGPMVLQVFYTDLQPQDVPVSVPPGGSIVQDVNLTTQAGSTRGTGIVDLDPFVVSAANEMSADALAINEQRFAPNIKNVVATGAFGDISEGNIGEFMKYLPGVSPDFADPNILSISVRGLPSSLTQVTSDGAQMANAHYGGSTRVFQFEQMSINSVSRVELTKVPTPADPADSMGGIVNLVSRTAFERKKPQFTYRVFLAGNEGRLTASKVPNSFEKRQYRVLPGADFNYTAPINDRFGIVVSGLTSNQSNDRYVSARVYNATAPGTGASYSAPFMQQYILQDAPRYTHRNSLSAKADWRITPNGVLSAGVQRSTFRSHVGMHQLVATVGGNGAPLPASGMRLSYGPDFTHGATGRGGLTMNGQFYNIRGTTDSGNVRYRFDNGDWEIKAGASVSASETKFTDTDDGHFFNVTSQLLGPIRVNFSDITDDRIGRLEIFNNSNQPVDYRDPNNYRLTAASSSLRDVTDEVSTADLSVRRRLDRFRFPFAVQAGAAQRVQERDTVRENINRTYNGPDGSPSTNDSPAPYRAQVYAGRDSGFGFVDLPWISPHRAWSAFQQNPALFSQTTAQQVAADTFRITNSELFKETVQAGYFEIDTRLFNSRLRVLTGVRYEKTIGKGQGALYEPSAVYQRNPDGTFARDARGALVRKPEAGAGRSLEENRVTRRERAARAKRSYDGYYPSLHLTYNFTDNLLARFAYAKTYGRPNFNQIIPRATINEFDLEGNTDPNAVLGTINVRNPALRPWSAHNYDLSLEYYTNQGGMFSAAIFQKEISGFFLSDVRIATAADLAELDLAADYVGWELRTQYNAADGRASGVEMDFKQPLTFLPGWGRHFEVFGNATFVKTIQELHQRTLNAGFAFRKRPVSIIARWNHHGLIRRNAIPALGRDAYHYDGVHSTLNLDVRYMISPRLSIFATASNALNAKPTAERFGGETPEYAKRFRVIDFGAQYTLGIRGTF